MATFVLKAEGRKDLGTRAQRKLRGAGRLPANIYGHKKPNRLVTFDSGEISQFILAGHRLLTVEVDGVEESGVLKEVQYDSLGTTVIHVDIARIDIHETVTMSVRIETIGVPKGISAGGALDLPKRDVLVEGLVTAIPEKIDLRIEALEIGQALRLKDLPPIPGCRYLDDPEAVVAVIHHKQVLPEAAPVPGAAPEMPEVIGRKKEEEPAAEEPEAKRKEPEGKK